MIQLRFYTWHSMVGVGRWTSRLAPSLKQRKWTPSPTSNWRLLGKIVKWLAKLLWVMADVQAECHAIKPVMLLVIVSATISDPIHANAVRIPD